MKTRWRTLSLSLIAALVLAIGGSAIVQAGGHKAKPATERSATESNSEATSPGDKADTDGDNVQQGDQKGSDQGGPNDAADSNDNEQAGSEVAGGDGPGGHADEPGSPNADHQHEGQE